MSTKQLDRGVGSSAESSELEIKICILDTWVVRKASIVARKRVWRRGVLVLNSAQPFVPKTS